MSDNPTALVPVPSTEESKIIEALREELLVLRESTYYRVLELETSASEADIIAAWGRFVDEWHPDRIAPNTSQEMRAVASEVYLCGVSANETLVDRARRRAYDKQLAAPEEPPTTADTVGKPSVQRRITREDDPFGIERARIENEALAELHSLIAASDWGKAHQCAQDALERDPAATRVRAAQYLVSAHQARAEQRLDSATRRSPGRSPRRGVVTRT